jgi:hypothetical protein
MSYQTIDFEKYLAFQDKHFFWQQTSFSIVPKVAQ